VPDDLIGIFLYPRPPSQKRPGTVDRDNIVHFVVEARVQGFSETCFRRRAMHDSTVEKIPNSGSFFFTVFIGIACAGCHKGFGKPSALSPEV
jgi:hypothetical protein